MARLNIALGGRKRAWSMSTDDSQRSNTEYEYEPFELIFLRRREEILKLVGLAGYALRALEGSARLTEVLKKPADAVERAREIEALAQAEVKADLPLLHSAAAVLIWGALEAAFRDFLVRWLASRPSSLAVPELNNVRVRIAEYESFSGEDRMRFLVGVLERELAATLKPGVGRFACLLKPFGIAPTTSEEMRRDLSELAAVRNVIVHRAGIADARLIELCPWLKLKRGDPVTVGHAAVERYVAAASEYAAAIIEAARMVAKSAPLVASAAQLSVAADRPQAAGG
jgi:hypothetical protein